MNEDIKNFAIFERAANWAEVPDKDKLQPHIKTAEAYNQELEAGVERAHAYLSSKVGVPSANDLQEAHGLMFGRIYEGAGQFRRTDSEAEGRKASRPEDIEKDLAAVEERAKSDFNSDQLKNADDQIATGCVYHAGLDAVGAFEVGNGPLNRLCLADQLEKQFEGSSGRLGRPIDAIDRSQYNEAMRAARGESGQEPNLTKLHEFSADFACKTLEVEAARIDKQMAKDAERHGY